MDIKEFRLCVHNRLNDMRNLNTLVQSRDFEKYYTEASEADREAMSTIVKGYSFTQLHALFKKAFKRPLVDLSTVELKKLAAKYGLKYYGRLTKASLLSELSKLEGLEYD